MAEGLVKDGMNAFSLQEEALPLLKGSDRRKIAIATAIKEQTTVSQGWIAARLKMKSGANVSQQVRRYQLGEIQLEDEQREWLETVKNC